MQSHIIKEDVARIRSEFDGELATLERKTVLITGSNGLIGSYIADTIAEYNKSSDRKIELVLVNKNPIGERSRLSHLRGVENVELLTRDLGREVECGTRADVILHAASRASPKAFVENPFDTINTNVYGTQGLLEKAVKDGCEKFIFFSSGENYGNPLSQFIPTPETYSGNIDPLDVRSCYTESKRLAENLCVQYFKKFNLPVSMARVLLSYGPGMKNDGKVISDFFSAALNKKEIKIRDAGESTRSFMYVADTARAVFRILFYGSSNGEAYNVAGDRDHVSIKGLAELIAESANNGTRVETNPEFIRKPTYGIDTRNLDISKLKGLGHVNQVGLKEGLYRLKSHFVETGEIYEK